jgi:hypothetical protein
VEGIELPSTLALLLRSDLRSARDRHFEDRLELGPSDIFAADVADDPTEPAAQQAMVALELLGMGIARTTTPELKFSVHTPGQPARHSARCTHGSSNAKGNFA